MEGGRGENSANRNNAKVSLNICVTGKVAAVTEKRSG